MKKQIPFLLLALFLLASPYHATAQSPSSLEEMQQRLREMQRQMMQGFEDLRSAMPDVSSDSSGIYFRFDTTFTGDGAHFFRFTPPGDLLNGDTGMEDFFQGFFDLVSPDKNTPGTQIFPKDDGQLPHPEDELLPEERLRQGETRQDADHAAPPPSTTPKPAKKKPSVPSIRI